MSDLFRTEILVVFLNFAIVVYLISIFRIRQIMLTSSDNGGWLTTGIFVKYLNRKSVNFIYLFWIFSSIISAVTPSRILATVCQFITFALCRYFFVFLRYRSIGRGGGAPAFMVYWLSLYCLLFQLSAFLHTDASLVYALACLDMSLIMTSAGFYKLRSGYLKGRGIEFGLCNGMWSRNPYFWRRLRDQGIVYRTLNLLSVYVELFISLTLIFREVLLIPGVLLMIMFIILQAKTKLGSLPITMYAASSVLMFASLSEISVYDLFLSEKNWFSTTLMIYALMLCVSTGWNWISFIGMSNKFPFLLQSICKRCVIFTGSIIWSVFSANHTEILVRKAHNKKYSKDVNINIALTSLISYQRYFDVSEKQWRQRASLLLGSLVEVENSTEWEFLFLQKIGEGGLWNELPLQEWKIDEVKNTLHVEELQGVKVWNGNSDGVFGPKRSKNYGDYS